MQTMPAEQLSAFLEEAKQSGVYELYYIEVLREQKKKDE